VDDVTLLLQEPLDLGIVAPGDTAAADAFVHNFAYGALQALLDVHADSLSGDARFFVEGGFTPASVGASAAALPVRFDAAGAAPGVYNGTLTLFTRDQQDLSGAAELAALTFDLTATVSAALDAILAQALPNRTGFDFVRPNPFRPSTELAFSLREAGRTDLRIYDVSGRMVTILLGETRAAGHHTVRWNGRDAAGAEVAPGIYFARLVAGDVTETRKLVRIR
jgi:hypothetical protein